MPGLRFGTVTAVRFRPSTRLPAGLDKKKAAARLVRLCNKHKGLTTRVVLEDASDPRSPLHTVLTWDDAKAGHEFRLIQCRTIIGACIFDYTPARGGVQTIRSFAHFTAAESNAEADDNEGVYLNVQQVLTDPKLRRIQFNKALVEFRSYQARWLHLPELQPLWDAFESAFPNND